MAAKLIARKDVIYSMGIDPGGTSGWAIIGIPRNSMFNDAPRKIIVFTYGQITGSYTDQAVHLMDIAASYKEPLAIAMESFYPMKPIIDESYLSPLAVIHRVQMLIDMGHVHLPIFYQTPNQAMQVANDERLRRWGLYVQGPDHIKDGTRHAITFIRRAKDSRPLRNTAWGTGRK